MPNVVEVVVKADDQASNVVNRVAGSFGGLKTALGAFAAGAGIVSFFNKVVGETVAAQDATAKLNAVYDALGNTSGVTRDRLDDLASEMQRTTRYSATLTKEAEAILLTFDRVRGEAFERTLSAAADLSAVFGTDLVGAARQLGAALQDPERGMQALRRAGVVFTEDQRKLVQTMLDAGESAKAQNFILTELERRYGRAAEAARNTLGGALAGLKNSFSDLFEQTKDQSSGAVDAINSLSDALRNPGIKSGIDTIVSGLASIVELALRGAAAVGNLIAGVAKGSKEETQRTIDLLQEKLDDIELRSTRAGVTRVAAPADQVVAMGRGSNMTVQQIRDTIESLKNPLEEIAVTARKIDFATATESLEEFAVTAKRIEPTALEELYQQWDDDTKTSTQQIVDRWEDAFQKIDELVRAARITQGEGAERKSAITDEMLQEVDLNQIKAKYKAIEQVTGETSEVMKGIWQGVGQSIQSTLSDALYNAEFSLDSLVDIFRRALADISAAIISSKIKDLLTEMFAGSGSSDSSGGFDWSSVLGSVFGSYAAGGGRIDGPTIVGEEGPELINGSGQQVYNDRQLAFAGGGGVNYSPQYNVQISGARDDSELRREFYEFVVKKSESDKNELMRTLYRNGYGRIR